MSKKHKKSSRRNDLVEYKNVVPARTRSKKSIQDADDLEEFQRPEVVKLNEIGDSIEGIYLGLQPIVYSSGSEGALALLKQSDGSLKAVSASYDIQRFLFESGFGEKIGEYLRITLDSKVNTGMPAPMKVYKFAYRKGLQLGAGTKRFTFSQLPIGRRISDGQRLIAEASEVPKESWEN